MVEVIETRQAFNQKTQYFIDQKNWYTGIIPNYAIILSDISSAVGGLLQRCLPSDFRREGITVML